jgi:hypothetical protein
VQEGHRTSENTYLAQRFVGWDTSAYALDWPHFDFRLLSQRGGEANLHTVATLTYYAGVHLLTGYMRSARTMRRFSKEGIGVHVWSVTMSRPRTRPITHESSGSTTKVSVTL